MWCMDGPNDAGCLLPIDGIRQVSEDVVVLSIVFIDGESWRFVVFLYDDKFLAVTNSQGNCWCCDNVTILSLLDHVIANSLGLILAEYQAGPSGGRCRPWCLPCDERCQKLTI